MRTALALSVLLLALLPLQAHAACRVMGEMMVCDNGQTFQRMGDDKIVDDWGHTWIVDDQGTIHTDQAYSTPLIRELLEEEGEEWSDEIEE